MNIEREQRELSNDDFREIINSRRIQSSRQYSRQDGHFNQPKRKPRSIFEQMDEDVEENEEPTTQYRDRAAERREGKVEEIQEPKGLDFELLREARKKLEEEAKQLKQLEEVLEEEPKVETQPEKTGPKFNTFTARNLYRIIQRQKESTKEEVFKPNQITFSYKLYEDGFNFIPTIKVRTKDDEERRDGIQVKTPQNIIEKLSKLMSDIQSGKWKPKPRPNVIKKEKVETKDEDIFDDVPEYVCKVELPPRKKEKVKEDVIPIIEASKFKYGPEKKPIDFKDTEFEEEKEPIEFISKKRDVSFPKKEISITDDYDECYPGTYESQFTDVVYNSDEEIDFEAMRRERKDKSYKRFRYDPEKWSKRRQMQMKPKKMNKAMIDSQWEKIQDIMKKRKGNYKLDTKPSKKIKHDGDD